MKGILRTRPRLKHGFVALTLKPWKYAYGRSGSLRGSCHRVRPLPACRGCIEEALSLRAEFLATLDEAEASLRHAAKDAS